MHGLGFPLCKPALSFSFETERFLVLGILLATSVCVGSFVHQIGAVLSGNKITLGNKSSYGFFFFFN